MADFPLQFGTQSHGGRYGPETGPRHINAYVEQIVEGEPPLPIYAVEGLKLFSTITGGGATRGMIVAGGALYVVSGTAVEKVDIGGSSTNIGAIPGSSTVYMAANAASPYQIAMVSEGKRFVIVSDTVQPITDGDLPPPTSVTFADQRVVYGIPDGRIFWSDLDDVTSINALSFSTAEGAPDGLERVFAHRLDVWLFGARTTEIWRSTADADEPFRRVSGGYIQQGCDSAASVASLGETIFWVNEKEQVVAATGYQPKVISHLDISRDIDAVVDKETITGFTYLSKGTGFYVITSATWTWVYNINTGKWFERSSDAKTNWRGKHAAHFQNKYIIGDDTTNVLYEEDQDTYDENGNLIVMTVRTPPVHAYPKRVSIDRLLLDFVTGVGLNSTDTDESSPQVMMRYSDDGGRSWSNELHRTLGVDGDYNARVAYNNLGITGRSGRIFEIKVSASVARALLHGAIEGDLIGT